MTSSTIHLRQPSSPVGEFVPPLEPGDRLSRAEFLRRYAAMAPNVKAERIEGKVHMPAAAVSADFHGTPHAGLMGWAGVYWAMTPGVKAADNSTIHLDVDNDPQPDACLYVLPSCGGQVKIDKKGFIVGSPEFVAEISGSAVSYDLNEKLNVYRRNQVREYLVHRVYDGEIDWFILGDGQYTKLEPDGQGIYRSGAFPGLWLASKSLVAEDIAEVLRVLQLGLASAEHAEFVKGLSATDRAV